MATGTTAARGAQCGEAALMVFQRMVEANRAAIEAIRQLHPVLVELEWALMSKAQRRRWCKRLIRNWKSQ